METTAILTDPGGRKAAPAEQRGDAEMMQPEEGAERGSSGRWLPAAEGLTPETDAARQRRATDRG